MIDCGKTFEEYDGVLKKNLELLDASFEQCLLLLNLLEGGKVEEVEEVSEGEKKEAEEAEEDAKKEVKKKQINTEYCNMLLDNQQKILSERKNVSLKTYGLQTGVNISYSNKNCSLKLFELETKEIPDSQKALERLMTQYHNSEYENDVDYRTKIAPFETAELSNESSKLSNRQFEKHEMDYSGLNLAEMSFLKVKNVKEAQFLDHLKAENLLKLKERLIYESLSEEKRQIELENRKWEERKNSILRFLGEDLQVILKEISVVKEEL